MISPTASALAKTTGIGEDGDCSLGEEHARFKESPLVSNRAARGMVTGVLLGAGLWGAILVLAGIRL